MALKYLYAPSGYKGGTSSGTAYGVLPNDSSADFDNFNRPSFATRTNKDGLLETYQAFGNNLVTNGDFATDSDWSKGNSSITISGGKANFNNTQSGFALTQRDFLANGKRYEVTFTVSNYQEGSIKVRYPFITPTVNSDGVHTVTGIASDAGFDDLQFQVVGITTLSIDDVSVKEVSLHVPRIDYSDGGCPSLLLERGKTNICEYSESVLSWNINPSNWGGTRTINALTSPDGRKSADLISVIQPSGVFTQPMYVNQGSTYSSSVYAKHISGTSILKFSLTANFHAGSGELGIKVDLSDGSIISNAIEGFANVKVIDVGNGWYRLCIQNHVASATSSAKFTCYAQDTSFSEYSIWGGQVEVGSTCTSYIPNLHQGSTTRNTDKGRYAANFDGMNSFEGVVEARFKAFPVGESSRITLGTDVNGNYLSRVTIGYGITGNVIKPWFMIAHAIGGSQYSQSEFIDMPSSFNIFDYNTYQLKFKAGNNELKINGELIELKDTFANLDFLFTKKLESISLNLFGDSTSNVFYGGIKHIKVYDSITDF